MRKIKLFIMKIRSIQLLVALLALVINEASAQKFKMGVIAGFVASDVVGIDPQDTDFHKAGVTLGGLLNTKISENNSIQFEILFTQKGSLQPADSANNYNFYKLSLNYVEVPLMFRHNIIFNIKQKPVDRFYIEAGPSYGRIVSIKENSNGNIITNVNNFNKNEVALNVGIGSRILKNLYFNVRFSNSIISAVKNNKQLNSFIWYTYNKGDNVVMSFSLRYVFDPGNN